MRYVIKQLSVLSFFTLIVFSPSLYATGLRELVGHWTFEKREELNVLTGNFPDIKLMGAKVVMPISGLLLLAITKGRILLIKPWFPGQLCRT